MKTTGRVNGIISNIVIVKADGAVGQNEICYVYAGDTKMMAEVIKVVGDSAYVQVFDSTRGLKIGDKVEFLFGVQQVHSADLLQVILDRICGGAGCDHTTLRIAGRRQIVVVIIVTHHESAFFLGLFRLFALVFVIVFHFGIVILVDIVLVEVVILPFVVHVIKVIVEIIKIGILDGIVFRSVLLDQVLFFFRFLAFLGGGGLLHGRLARRLRSGL